MQITLCQLPCLWSPTILELLSSLCMHPVALVWHANHMSHLCYEHEVRLPICMLVDCYNWVQQKSENRNMIPDSAEGYGECGVLHFGGNNLRNGATLDYKIVAASKQWIKRLTHCTISTSAELLVTLLLSQSNCRITESAHAVVSHFDHCASHKT